MLRAALLSCIIAVASPAVAAPTRSSPLAVAPDGPVFVVNPDSGTVARIAFDASRVGTLTHEVSVGRYPRTLALDATGHVFTAVQTDDTVSRLDQADLGNRIETNLGSGCGPYGVAVTPAGDSVLVTCQGTSTLVVLDLGLTVVARVKLAWPNARAIALSDGGKAYVTHFLTAEPGTDAHVSVVDVASRSIATVFAIPADTTTCETQHSGQGVLNLLSAIVIVPSGPYAGEVWVGGTQENDLSKGLFERFPGFAGQPGAALFPRLTFRPFPDPPARGRRRAPVPAAAAARNLYDAGAHDISRFAIYELDGADGHVVGKLDVDAANTASDIEFSPDGTVAAVVDQMTNSLHLFNTRRGRDGDVTTLFGPPSANGPGGAAAAKPCTADSTLVVDEAPYRVAPQAALTTIGGYDPVRLDAGKPSVVRTGLDFDTATYVASGTSQMRAVPDGIGTAPIGVRLAPDGRAVYVANYLARNVVTASTDFRCAMDPTRTCATSNDCGGADCVPLLLGEPVLTVRTQADDPGCVANGRIADGGSAVAICDPTFPAILDGKTLFNTAARDASVANHLGLGHAAPLFDEGPVPGSAVSTSRDASHVTCSTCHADFGGQDGRTWDFSQLGSSLRNTMDLRGRAGFAPGHCGNAAGTPCSFDAACGDGDVCRMAPALVPPNIPAVDRVRYFNPMLTVHWNGDRDEVEDFEHTYRSLMGAGDCNGREDDDGACFGALVQRSLATSADPVDVNDDLAAPNRNLPGRARPDVVAGIRLTHVADFVYSLAEFVKNPNQPDAAAERGRLLFDDPQTRCVECHDSAPVTGERQFFTDKRPVGDGFDPASPAGADRNNPFLRHDVGTANVFDGTDPNAIAQKTGTFPNVRLPIPAHRRTLKEYVTPVLNDVWSSAPFLHDGSAPFLLDVVRPCDSTLDDCLVFGRGRNLDDRHGVTSILTPQQLNDLTAFQKTLTRETRLEHGGRVVFAGALALTDARLTFPRRRGGSFAVSGVLSSAPGPLDIGAGITVSVATPAGEQMAIFSRSVPMRARRRGFIGRVETEGAAAVVKLRDLGGGKLRLRARAHGRDVRVLDADNRDLTLAVEVPLAGSPSVATFVKTRSLRGGKRNFELARGPTRSAQR